VERSWGVAVVPEGAADIVASDREMQSVARRSDAHSVRERFPLIFSAPNWLIYPSSAVFVIVLSFVFYHPRPELRELAEVTFLLAVVLIALVWGRGAAVTAALASEIMYNYLYVPPPYVFTVPTSAEGFLLVGLLAVGLCLGTVTDRMRAARKQLQELAASDRLQKTLLNSISHDLRTPLTAIIGCLSTLLLEGQDMDEKVRHELRTIAYDAAKQLDRLVAQLLEMTRLEAGMTQVKREPGNLGDVVGAALTQLRGTLNGRRCLIDLPSTLPMIRMDAVLLSHALVNILDNAIKYSPPEAPIEVDAHPTDGWIVISVRDRGVGIPQADLGRVLEKFYRVGHASDAESNHGFGLGLAIAKGIVEAHGGQIWLEHRDGGGTVAKIKLPLN
jgi:two-component system, OmpR family, sensor histidine kinase KdpD